MRMQLNFHKEGKRLMKRPTNCCKRMFLCVAPQSTFTGLYIKLIIMSFPLAPQSLSSIFFTSLVSSVRNPITVIKSADPQRALLHTAIGRETHGEGETRLDGMRLMERDMKEWMRGSGRDVGME